MTVWEILLLLAAGTAAGMINSVVGSGSLVTFPVLVALGNPPILANVTNNIGVLPGSISAAWTNRVILAGRWRRAFLLAIPAFLGGAAGAGLLLVLPPEAFRAIVPVLIAFACLLVMFGPALRRRLAARTHGDDNSDAATPKIVLTVGATAVYGGYFGAAQGIILLSSLMLLMRGGIQVANAHKNVFAAAANLAAGIVFVLVAPVNWIAALVIAVGATAGGWLGARVGKRIPESVYRIAIIVIGAAAIVYFALSE